MRAAVAAAADAGNPGHVGGGAENYIAARQVDAGVVIYIFSNVWRNLAEI
ncbi:MAG: hypothetical protein V3V05_05770 [Pontiella sp.]